MRNAYRVAQKATMQEEKGFNSAKAPILKKVPEWFGCVVSGNKRPYMVWKRTRRGGISGSQDAHLMNGVL